MYDAADALPETCSQHSLCSSHIGFEEIGLAARSVDLGCKMIDELRSCDSAGYTVWVAQSSTHNLHALGFQQIGTAGRPGLYPDGNSLGQQVPHQGRPQKT